MGEAHHVDVGIRREVPLPRFLQLDGLRAAAAVGVMLYHLEMVYGLPIGFGRAYLFVDLFFLLSGFVLTLSAERRWNGRADAAAFVRARWRRLAPTMAVGSALGAIIHGSLGATHVPVLLLLALLCIPTLGRTDHLYPLNGVQWSLAWELVANVIHVFVLRRIDDRWLAAIVVVMGIALVCAIVAMGGNTAGPTPRGWWLAVARVGWSYPLGILIARRYARAPWRSSIRWPVALLLPIIIVLLLPRLPFTVPVGDTLFVMGLMPPIFAILVAVAPPRYGGRLLARAGAISFPLYAVHLPLLCLFRVVNGSGLGATGAVVASLVVAEGGHRMPSLRTALTRQLVRRRETLPVPARSCPATPPCDRIDAAR